MKALLKDKVLLGDAIAEFTENIHKNYPGIKIKTIPVIEDEDLAIEVTIPSCFSPEEVEDGCHKECIKIEDKYNVYILPLVVKQ